MTFLSKNIVFVQNHYRDTLHLPLHLSFAYEFVERTIIFRDCKSDLDLLNIHLFYFQVLLQNLFSATIVQIKDGKHMYRELEAHFSLYLVFYKLHMTRFIDDNQEIVKELKEVVINSILGCV